MTTSELWQLYTWLLGVNLGLMVSTWIKDRFIRLGLGMAFLLAATTLRMMRL